LNRGSLDRYRAGYQFTPAEIRAVVPPDEWNFCRPLPSTSMRRKLPMLSDTFPSNAKFSLKKN
jgi:hypothetical protein